MGKRERRCEERFFLLTSSCDVDDELMNDNNDDDVDVGEVDGMGWGERMRWQDTDTAGEREEGTGQRDVIGGEGADANRRSHSTSALVRYVAGPRFLINNNATTTQYSAVDNPQPGRPVSVRMIRHCLYEVQRQYCLSLSQHLANAGPL